MLISLKSLGLVACQGAFRGSNVTFSDLAAAQVWLAEKVPDCSIAEALRLRRLREERTYQCC
jgi:hypothetical protein